MDANAKQNIHNSDIPEVCRSCEARHGGICGVLTPEQLVVLSKHTDRKVIPSSVEIQAETETQQSFANILSGVVKLSKLMSDGRQQIVGLQFAPDFLGRPFSSEASVNAEAATDVRVCSFPKSVLYELMKETPEMEHKLHQQNLRELDEARDWMLTLGRKTATEKVASFLYMVAAHIDPENEGAKRTHIELELPLKRAEIADFLGLTIETVSRQLTNLRKRGVIEDVTRKSVVISDMDRLVQAVGND